MSTLATVSLPANSPASSSSAGPIILQGPHHSAQKSTSTGPDLLASMTSVAKLWSVTGLVLVLMGFLATVGQQRGHGVTLGQDGPRLGRADRDGPVTSGTAPGSCGSSSASGNTATRASRVHINAQRTGRP